MNLLSVRFVFRANKTLLAFIATMLASLDNDKVPGIITVTTDNRQVLLSTAFAIHDGFLCFKMLVKVATDNPLSHRIAYLLSAITTPSVSRMISQIG
jgi:hypothetical protein